MDKHKFLLYLHLLCSFFFFGKEILLADKLTPITIFSSIIYITMIIVPAIFNSRILKAIVSATVLPGVVFVSFYMPAILLLLPLHITRIISIFSFSVVIEVILFFLPLLIIRGDSMLYYLIFSSLLFFVYKTISGYDTKVRKQEQLMNILERKNQNLSRRISRLEELDREKEFLIKLEERNRIAQKLHDELGHTITGSIVHLEAAHTILTDDPDKAKKMISTVSSVLNKGMNSIRKGLKSLKPDSAQIGIQRVKQLLGDFEKNTSINTQIKTEGNLFTISIQVWQSIIMNIKEALTNVVKHSKASDVYIDIIVLNKIIKVSIKDNGKGSASIHPGMGLLGIEERTKEAGGMLILDGSDGFSIIMIFKYAA